MTVSGVRLARTSDVDDVASVNVRSWRSRFTGVLPADVLDSLDTSDIAMTWASAILNPPLPTQRLLVAVDGDVARIRTPPPTLASCWPLRLIRTAPEEGMGRA
jgi:hypothetical protein